MSGGKIHFRNKPFSARVDGMGDEPISCTPVVYDEGLRCGVGVFYGNGRGQVWGPMTPRDLIAAWRGTEVLRRLDVIESGTLAAAYCAGVRGLHNEPGVGSPVGVVIAKIGQEIYDRIMTMPVPEHIIRAILDNQLDDFPPDLYPITDEVRAGTIPWRQEFVAYGVWHPDEIDAEKRAQEKTIARFERFLASYARSRGLPRQCVVMDYTENALLALVREKADQAHPANVVVALAGIVGELASFEASMAILPIGPCCSPAEYAILMGGTRENAISCSVAWLSSLGRSRPVFWRRQQFAHGSARELLSRLLEEYLHPPG